ncbi:MAG: hypothetical protein GTN62_04620 [Gemmatimonadales bacterium]|nr:hypothetical protein [Gemmatimonadales bacterium]NIN10621.1 hypothetical protein [Gemmatimonadales bacterium]NIN49383.1 hypothetical protein [Gemmatimonadales bacterium]NIP06847.1 hypothetical protein [Gemmatimonadales bacterium]NIR01521.1 hypothetical protein [Gemmatimonadales bacterium]
MRREDGFALPMTIFVLAMVTIMLSAVFVRVQMDRRVAESSGDVVNALAVAESGLQTYLGTVNFDACYRAIRPLDGDSTRINVNGGYAWVVPHVIQKPADTLLPWKYVVRSTGYLVDPTQGSDPQAVRTVAQFAYWQRNSMEVLAAFTAANGLVQMASSSGAFYGEDVTGWWLPGCEDPNLPALRVPNGQRPNNLSRYTLNGTSPRVREGGSGKWVADLTKIDWVESITGGIEPDYTSFPLGSMDFGVTIIEGDLNINFGSGWGMGSGILIVTEDLDVNGSSWFYWLGVVLVGGEIEWDTYANYVRGAVVSGLYEQTGRNADVGDVDGNYLYVYHDSYYVRRALASLAGFAPMTNTWIDNWASY